MFEGEYTHEGDRCTFETLAARFVPADRGLRAIGEMVHDIDCKDARFGRPETSGFERLITGITRAHHADEDRLSQRGRGPGRLLRVVRLTPHRPRNFGSSARCRARNPSYTCGSL